MLSINAKAIGFEDFLLKEGDARLQEYVSPRILVPSFQRNYAWDKKHVKDFIYSVNENNEAYYIGNILIQNGRVDLLVDGQQRITTLFLIIKALEQEIEKEAFERIIFYNKQEHLLRLEFTRDNLNSSFKKIVIDNNLDIESFPDENSKKILQNFNFIKKELNKIEDLRVFKNKVIRLIFVVIKFDSGYDVNQLFEGLNSKGKILSPVQLTKNALLGSARSDLQQQDKITNIWEDIERNFENNEIVWFDKFLRHRGFNRYGYVSSKNLFKKIKDEIKSQNILDFSEKIKIDSELYIKIRKGSLNKEDIRRRVSNSDWLTIKYMADHISMMDLDQIFSTIYSSFVYANASDSYANGTRGRLYRDISFMWSFSLLAKYSSIKPSLFERIFAEYSHNLFLGKYDKAQENIEELSRLKSYFNKNAFIENLNDRICITGENEKKISSKNNRNFVAPLLLLYLTGGRRFIVDGLTIEHIVPKGDLSKWNIGSKYIKYVKKDRYKLGNLTLLKKDELKNDSFSIKAESYKKSVFKRNRKLPDDYKEFNSKNPSDAIEKRGKIIATEIYDILIKKI